MKKNIAFICFLSVIILAACNIGETADNNEIPTGDNYISSENPPVDEDTEILTLQERLFVGEWTPVTLNGESMGGPMFDWYNLPFNVGYMGISSLYINYIGGQDAFNVWINQFVFLGGERDAHEAHIRSFADDFGLTVDDFIRLHEQQNGMSIEESDALILWAREIFEIDSFAVDENGNRADSWDFRLTSAEIRAKFSDCVYEIWEHFPGYGVVQNGNVYSPEWIIQNVEYAMLEEDIPIEEVERILDIASYFLELEMEVELALEELEIAQDILESR